jgi:hypothetical protein
MIRWRGRVWLDGSMFIENAAAAIMCRQAAYDYGFRDAGGIMGEDYRARGAKFMLWLGRLDVESTEMYEGDVVEMKYGQVGVVHGVVRWDQGQCRYVISQYIGINRYDYSFSPDLHLRVVGNICEHSGFMAKVRTGGLDELPADLLGLREQL